MIYEVRDYHYRPDLIDKYKVWAQEATVILRRHLDVVGFGVDEGDLAPEIKGTDPIDSPIGTANVTWIIRWESKAVRDTELRAALGSDDWLEMWSRHPDPTGYRQVSSRFMTEL